MILICYILENVKNGTSVISILFSILVFQSIFPAKKPDQKNRYEINSTRKVYPFIINH
nr:MAG TPA: hypothetical protein [Caudoviricetes sp.]